MHWLVRSVLPQVLVTSRTQSCLSALTKGRVLPGTALILTSSHFVEVEGVHVCVWQVQALACHSFHHGIMYPGARFCLIPSSHWNNIQARKRGISRKQSLPESCRCLLASKVLRLCYIRVFCDVMIPFICYIYFFRVFFFFFVSILWTVYLHLLFSNNDWKAFGSFSYQEMYTLPAVSQFLE